MEGDYKNGIGNQQIKSFDNQLNDGVMRLTSLDNMQISMPQRIIHEFAIFLGILDEKS